MLKEIERKFLLNKSQMLELIERAEIIDKNEIEQHYLPIANPIDGELRVRKSNSKQNGEVCFLTIKSVGDLVRQETEIKITSELATHMVQGINEFVKKTRYSLDIGNELVLELDVFFQSENLNGLILAEIEFKDENGKVPEHLSDILNEFNDVTFENSFKNKNLAKINSKDIYEAENSPAKIAILLSQKQTDSPKIRR